MPKWTVNNAVEKAQAALDSVTALMDDTADPTDALTRALQQAMAVAEGHLDDAIAIRDGAALAAALVAVRGADPEAEGYPKTPADFGMDVAMDINDALGPASGTDGSRLQGAHTSSGAAPDLTAFPDAVQTDDQQGTTWEVIVGSENVTDQRIASTGDDTDPVRAMSFGDMATRRRDHR